MNQVQYDRFLTLSQDPFYKPILPLFYDEYKSLLNGLKNKPKEESGWTVVDTLRTAVGQDVSPITFGDVR
jgi:hypothetical protein